MNKKDELNNRLKELRQKLNLTQKELAEILDISRQSLSNLEKGQFFPSFNLMLELENFFDMPIRKIYNNINNKKKAQSRYVGTGQGGIMDKNFSPLSGFDQMFSDAFGFGSGSSFPKMNIYTDDSSLVVEAEVPGMSKDDLEINLTKDSLSINGEKKESQEVKEGDFVRRESSFGQFQRSIDLPVEVDDSKAKASIKNGRLKISAPITSKESRTEGLEIEER